MVSVLYLQDTQTGQYVALERNAHLGRGDLKWAVNQRQMPAGFSSLEVAVRIDELSPQVLIDDGRSPSAVNAAIQKISRNHCGIVLADGQYHVQDLNSLNGTYLNGRRLRSGAQKVLHPDDRLGLGTGYQFSVLRTASADQGNYALIVGHAGGGLLGGELWGVENDLSELAAQLSPRGFKGNITTLLNGAATRRTVLGQLDEIAAMATESSHTLFHYSGHGSFLGLHAGLLPITPIDLYAKLGNIRGKKAVILDTCQSGIFTLFDFAIPEDTLVVAAAGPLGLAAERPATELGGAYMGTLTKAVVRFLKTTPDRLNLGDLESYLAKLYAGKKFFRMQHPRVAGAKVFTVVTNYRPNRPGER